jgi:hypothetical protein
MRDGWLFLRACWYGWRMLRFPTTVPWVQAPIAEWQEIGAHVRERVV